MCTKETSTAATGSVIRWQDAAWGSELAHGAPHAILAARHVQVPSPHRFVDLVRVPAGASIGRHTHASDSAEIYVAVAGSARFEVDGVASPVSVGDVMCNEPGGTHALWNDGDVEFAMVVVESEVTPR